MSAIRKKRKGGGGGEGVYIYLCIYVCVHFFFRWEQIWDCSGPGWVFYFPRKIKTHLDHNYKQHLCATLPFIHRTSWRECVCPLALLLERGYLFRSPLSLHLHGLLYGCDKIFSSLLLDESWERISILC